MSVTFSFEHPRFSGGCTCTDPRGWTCPRCALGLYMCQCDDAPASICDFCLERQVNVANSNAREILATLALDNEDLCGEQPARMLLRRIERVIAGGRVNDAEIALQVDGRMIYMGRREGYLTEKLQRLAALCVLAQTEAGDLARVTWG